jgi:hypothetical protein
MLKPSALVIAVLCAASSCVSAGAQGSRRRAGGERAKGRAPFVFLDSTREGDGLKGPVRRIETEVVGVELRAGETLSKPPSLLERTLYDERGRRVENETYPVVGGGARGGRETHTYDERGNVAETVVRDAGGAVLSRTLYAYEFDEHGNWIKMTASVAVSNGGRVEYEPIEITKRAITYYLLDKPGDQRAPGGGEAAKAGGTPAEAVRVSSGVGAAAGEKVTTTAASTTPTGARAVPELVVGGVLNERATWLPRPAFPVNGERLQEPLTVPVEVVVDITGRVVSARAQGGPPALRKAAERAARRATFLPFYAAGRPVRSRGVINYAFNYLP